MGAKCRSESCRRRLFLPKASSRVAAPLPLLFCVESSAPADPHPRLRGLDSISWRNIGGALHSKFLWADHDMWRWALFLFLHHGLETTGTGLQEWHWHQQQCVAANVSAAEVGPSKQKWTWFHQPTSIHTRKVHRKPR